MPKEHEYQYEKWNPRRVLNWANSIGAHTTALMQSIMDSRSHQARGYKSCMAILSFSKTYGAAALEMASAVAHELRIHKVASIESMLKTKSYLLHNPQTSANNTFLNNHENIRGGAYYAQINNPTIGAKIK
jgi:hypothetical protein